jgi:hypothetical protein
MRESPPRDAGVSVMRCGSLRREMRHSLPSDAGVSATRCGSLGESLPHPSPQVKFRFGGVAEKRFCGAKTFGAKGGREIKPPYTENLWKPPPPLKQQRLYLYNLKSPSFITNKKLIFSYSCINLPDSLYYLKLFFRRILYGKNISLTGE